MYLRYSPIFFSIGYSNISPYIMDGNGHGKGHSNLLPTQIIENKRKSPFLNINREKKNISIEL